MATVKEVVQAFLGQGTLPKSTRSASLHAELGPNGVFVLRNNRAVLALRVGNRLMEKVFLNPHNSAKIHTLLYTAGTVPGDASNNVSHCYIELAKDMTPSEVISIGPAWWRETPPSVDPLPEDLAF